MRFGFVTCVELGLSCMQAIYDAGGHLDLAITLPDDRAVSKSGRVYLDTFCNAHAIPLIKSPNINDETVISAVREHEIDWLFIIGWSQIAHAEILAAPTRGALGMHPTLLPEGRGRAAIPWAILKGLHQTGQTLEIMRLHQLPGTFAQRVQRQAVRMNVERFLHQQGVAADGAKQMVMLGQRRQDQAHA